MIISLSRKFGSVNKKNKKNIKKRHNNIIAQIKALPNDDFRQLNFEPSCEVRRNGVFEKRHKNIIRDIKALPRDEFNRLNFEPVEYKDAKDNQRTQKCVR